MRPDVAQPGANCRLGIAKLEQRLAVSRQTVWRWCKAGTFPAPHYLGERRYWFVDQIAVWEAEQMARPMSRRKNPANLADRRSGAQS